MRSTTKLFALFLFSFSALPLVYAQDDEARSQSGLPTYIGRRPGSNPALGSDASLSGTVTVNGLSDENKEQTLTVAVLVNGVLVARQRIKNRGAFSFIGIPRNHVTLLVEADNLEIGSYPLGPLTPPPLPNRHDIILTWTGAPRAKHANAVLSLRDSYSRTDSNQKAFDKAVAALKDKKSDNSVKLFRQIVENDANDFVAWTELGNLYFTQEKFPEAENSYGKAIVLKADFLPALVNMGKVQLSQKKFDPSIETLSKALAASPDSADVNHYLGEAYLQSKKGSKAVVYLNKAVELEPVEKAEVHLRLASLYNAAGVKDRAVAEYKMFLEKVPAHPEKAKLEKYIAENSPK